MLSSERFSHHGARRTLLISSPVPLPPPPPPPPPLAVPFSSIRNPNPSAEIGVPVRGRSRMSKVWGGVGAWALDAERAEAEEREQAAAEAAAAAAAAATASAILAGDSSQSFPSLKEAASKQTRKKKKPVAVPPSQFATGSYGMGGGRSPAFDSRRLTPEEMLRLPTGPRERSPEELGRHGGGFRSYGGAGGGPRGGFSGRRGDDDDGLWGGPGGRRGYGGSDVEPRRGPPARASDFDQPSRADEVGNWGAGKKLAPPPAFSGRGDRYSSFGGGSSSRAEELDSWSSVKKPFASDYPSFGTGRRDSRARPDSDPDRWVREPGGTVTEGGERPKLNLDPPKRAEGVLSEPVRTKPSPFGSARPREEVLAEKGLDWRKTDVHFDDKKTSRPTSSQSSRPSSSQSSRPGSPGLASTVSKPKVNPFGDAKPREVLLQQKGVDWRKIDLELEHRSVDRPETNEEKLLKKEIIRLKAQAAELEERFNDRPAGSSAELTELHEEIVTKERDLELLIRQLDDRVKFGEKAVGSIRPGSGSSRSDSSSTRALSRSGMPEDLRTVEIIDRPRSHGGRTGNIWAKSMDDRRGFQRGRDRSFFDSASAVRTSSRIGW